MHCNFENRQKKKITQRLKKHFIKIEQSMSQSNQLNQNNKNKKNENSKVTKTNTSSTNEEESKQQQETKTVASKNKQAKTLPKKANGKGNWLEDEIQFHEKELASLEEERKDLEHKIRNQEKESKEVDNALKSVEAKIKSHGNFLFFISLFLMSHVCLFVLHSFMFVFFLLFKEDAISQGRWEGFQQFALALIFLAIGFVVYAAINPNVRADNI